MDADAALIVDFLPTGSRVPSLGDHWVHGHMPNISFQLERVLVVPDFFHFKMAVASKLLGSTSEAEIVLEPLYVH